MAVHSFFVLGIDSEGHAANFVETEQIVQYNNNRASFVQVSEARVKQRLLASRYKKNRANEH